MIKPTPNPPEPNLESDPTSPYESPDSRKLHDAAERALDHYLLPADRIRACCKEPERMYMANPKYNTESLLANASETLGSATEMINNFAATLDTPRRKTALGIAQVIMVAELAVNQALDHIELS